MGNKELSNEEINKQVHLKYFPDSCWHEIDSLPIPSSDGARWQIGCVHCKTMDLNDFSKSNYVESLGDAFKIVGVLRGKGLRLTLDNDDDNMQDGGEYCATFHNNKLSQVVSVENKSPAKAICLASLLIED